jgi:membrane-bound lytic murein transglycosylase D
MRVLKLLPLLVLTALGCATSAKSPQALSAAAASGAAHAAADHWEAALQRWNEDGSEEAAGSLREAGPALLSATRACAAQPACPTDALLQRYAELLERQTQLMLGLGGEAAALQGQGEGGDLGDSVAPEDSTGGAVVASLPAAGDTITLLKGRELRELILLNPQVKAALNEWLTWMRPQLIESHENYQFLRHRMWPEYEQAGLPEALLFGILAKESAGKVHAVSSAGAAGPLQFMPATGQRFGLVRDPGGFDQRFDPQLAARANVRYLNERFAEFNNDLALALAAYNGGEGRMKRLWTQSGRRGFWDPAVNRQLPGETRDYVPMVLAAAWLFLHPEDYGLEFPKVDGSATTLTLAAPATLNQLAICLGQEGTRSGWFRALRNLNPRFLPHLELSAGTTLQVPAPVPAAYAANCLDGPRAEAAVAVASAAKRHDGSSATASSYTVRQGDTIGAISRRHHCSSPQALARVNGIKPPGYLIKPGQTISLSGCRG